MEFPRGHATFTCATQLVAHQMLDIFGTRGRIAVEIPWSMPSDRSSRLLIDDGASLTKDNLQTMTFAACDQFQVQCELFCEAVRSRKPAPVPIEDAVANMRVIDAISRSALSGRWEKPELEIA